MTHTLAMTQSYWLVLIPTMVLLLALPAGAWQDCRSVDDLIERYPQQVTRVLEALNLDWPGLEEAKAAVERGDQSAACRAIVDYYRNSDTAAWLRTPSPPAASDRRDASVEAFFEDTFTFYTVTARQPRLPDGGLDWAHRGPDDDLEWAVALSRHQHFNQLLKAWRQMGNADYASLVDQHLRDWVVHHPVPRQKQDYRNYAWTPLNPGIRLGTSWPQAFFGFQDAEAFTPATRILMLASIADQCEYLIQNIRRSHNFATFQMQGLGLAALAFPEFRDAPRWDTFAQAELTRELVRQVYPDGVQKELTAHYHVVALRRFNTFAQHMTAAGRSLPAGFKEMLENMWSYVAYAMRPDGALPLNNDSDRQDHSGILLQSASAFGREDWRYIATQGREGRAPEGLPSVCFPWAGQLISRSGWDADAHWSVFDAGPWGVSHQHNDMLHLSVHAHGRDILVDGGRFAYHGQIAKQFRDPYSYHSRGHNVVLVDGLGQCAYEPEAKQPLRMYALTESFDFCRATFAAGFAGHPSRREADREIAASHTRAVVYLRGVGWLVVDQIVSSQERTLTPLWHFHPDCTVTTDDRDVVSVDAGKGNVRITPIGQVDWNVRLVKGQEQPHPQGWYSPRYNVIKPSPCAEYSGRVSPGEVFGWLIMPGRGDVPAAQVEQLPAPPGAMRVKVTPPGGRAIEVAVRLADDTQPIALSDGMSLRGACAVLMPDQPAMVVHGELSRDESPQD